VFSFPSPTTSRLSNPFLPIHPRPLTPAPFSPCFRLRIQGCRLLVQGGHIPLQAGREGSEGRGGEHVEQLADFWSFDLTEGAYEAGGATEAARTMGGAGD